MSPVINTKLSEVESSAPKFDPGVYSLIVTKVTYQPPEGDKPPKLLVTFKEANAEEGDRRSITHRFDTTGDFRSYLKQFLERSGHPDPDADELDTDTLMGLCAKASIKHQTVSKDGETVTYANIGNFIKVSDED